MKKNKHIKEIEVNNRSEFNKIVNDAVKQRLPVVREGELLSHGRLVVLDGKPVTMRGFMRGPISVSAILVGGKRATPVQLVRIREVLEAMN
jgi:hypothetical protein